MSSCFTLRFYIQSENVLGERPLLLREYKAYLTTRRLQFYWIMDSDLIALSRIRQANFPSTGAQALFRRSTDTRFHPSCHIYLVVRVITDFWSYPKIRHANNNYTCLWNLLKADSKDKWAEVADTFLNQSCVRYTRGDFWNRSTADS